MPPYKILIAPDSFKDCLSAKEVAKAIESGILEAVPDAMIETIPLSDGGEGLLEVLTSNMDIEIIDTIVHDPLYRVIKSQFGICNNGKTAIIEMAKASGLELLNRNERNPALTTTYGTGELIYHAVDYGCRDFIIGIGGSATNDAGIGMAKALGVKFLNDSGTDIGRGGMALCSLDKIDITGIDPRIKTSVFRVACDVENILIGIEGASMVYGGQKGGNPNQMERLDRCLTHFSDVVIRDMNKNIAGLKYGGAAGGLGAGLMTFLDAKLVRGIDLVMEILKVEKQVKCADFIITGEGHIDNQSFQGKTISGLLRLAKKHQKPLYVVTGCIGDLSHTAMRDFRGISVIQKKGMSIEYSTFHAKRLIREEAKKILSLDTPH